jgi:hypothetical protein
VTLQFHIFRCDPDGTVLWQAAVETLELARTRVQTLTAESPGAFIIFNPATGQKISIGKNNPRVRTADESVA